MAGVIALHHGARAALALRHLETARRLGRRELDRFAALAQTRGVGRDVICHMVAYNELADGIPIAQLLESVATELATRARSADADIILPLLQQELPPRTRPEDAASGPRLATLQPDLIGEAAIIEAFTGEPSRESEANKIVGRAYALGGQEAARVLVRLVQDFAYALEDERATEQERATARRVMGWLLDLSRQVEDPELLLPLVFALPAQTTILREPAAELTARLATVFRQKAEHTDGPTEWIKAAWLVNALAFRLSYLGRREEALTVGEEAVRLYRALAAARPDAFTPDLAGSLNNLANRLSDLGRREEALTAAEEAVRHYRALAAARPDAFGVELARSLWVLGDLYGETGNLDFAIGTLAEGVSLLTPIFVAVPAAVAGMTAGLLQSYLKLCEVAGREPDEGLVTPVIAEFERLNATEERK